MSGLFPSSPELAGHRGFGKGVVEGHLENTLPSFLAAAEHGVQWVEVDVRVTGDSELVVAHHPTTEDGQFLVDLTLEQAAEAGVLPLAELLPALPPHVGVNFDVKTSLEDALRERPQTTGWLVAECAADEITRRRVLVSSFDPAVLLMTRERAPGVPVGLLTWLYFPLRKAIPAARHLGVDVVAAHVGSFAPNRIDPAPLHREAAWSVRVAHEAGLDVVAWCPRPEELPMLADAGVDCMVVNDVPSALAFVAERAAAGAETERLPTQAAR